MGQLNQVTQQTAASSGEVATAASDLSAQSESLKTLVSDLVRTVTGKSDTSIQLHSTSEKVVSLKEHQQKKAVSKPSKKPQPAQLKKRAMGDDSIPTRNDDRFEDL